MSVIQVLPRYHFSLPSYHNFCKSSFCHPSQIWTLENGCEKRMEKCDNILLSVKDICSEDCEVNAWSEKRLRESTIFHWHKALSEGRETTALFPYVGRLLRICTEEMVNTVAVVVWEDRHTVVRQLARVLDVLKLYGHTILHETLKMRRVTACRVPHFLTWIQKHHRIEIYSEWLKRIVYDLNMMGHVITCDESWIYHFDQATKWESMHWKSPQPPVKKKVRQAKLINKVILILFFDAQEAVY